MYLESLAFLRGYFFNISYKKIIRRNILAAMRMQNFLERMRVSNFLIKNYIVWKKDIFKNNDLYISKKDMFFNSNSITQANKRLNVLFLKKFKTFEIKKNLLILKLKNKKLIMNYFLKNSKYNMIVKDIFLVINIFLIKMKICIWINMDFLKIGQIWSYVLYTSENLKNQCLVMFF